MTEVDSRRPLIVPRFLEGRSQCCRDRDRSRPWWPRFFWMWDKRWVIEEGGRKDGRKDGPFIPFPVEQSQLFVVAAAADMSSYSPNPGAKLRVARNCATMAEELVGLSNLDNADSAENKRHWGSVRSKQHAWQVYELIIHLLVVVVHVHVTKAMRHSYQMWQVWPDITEVGIYNITNQK